MVFLPGDLQSARGADASASAAAGGSRPGTASSLRNVDTIGAHTTNTKMAVMKSPLYATIRHYMPLCHDPDVVC